MKLLLSREKTEKAVKDWVDRDFPVRSIQLDRGHWEYIAPVIAKAQLNHIFNLDTKTTSEVIVKLEAHLDKLYLKEMAK